MSMILFLGWFGLACLGASLALAVLAWAYRRRCPVCGPVRWRLTRPALDGQPILHSTSDMAQHGIRFMPYGRPFVGNAANLLDDPLSPVKTVDAVLDPLTKIPRYEWRPKSASVWRGD